MVSHQCSSAQAAAAYDNCGNPNGLHLRLLESVRTAWAVDPTKGPIVGEIIIRYGSVSDARLAMRRSKSLRLPCEFTKPDGTRWRTERLRPPSEGDDGRVDLVRSLDVPDGYNYEVAFVAGSYWFGYVMNVRQPAEGDVHAQIAKAWSKAQREGIGSH